MDIDDKRIYRKRNPLLIALKVLGGLLAAIIFILIVLFFSFQKYIVYTPDGLKLDIPYLQQYRNK